MKVTKEQLRQIINEEMAKAVNEISDAEAEYWTTGGGSQQGTPASRAASARTKGEKMSKSDFAKRQMAHARGRADAGPGSEALGGGITDAERAIVADVQQKMLKVAAKGNLEAGQIAMLLDKVRKMMDQYLGSK